MGEGRIPLIQEGDNFVMPSTLSPFQRERPRLILRDSRICPLLQQPFHHSTISFLPSRVPPAEWSGRPFCFAGVDICAEIETDLCHTQIPFGGATMQQRDTEPIAAVGVKAMFHSALAGIAVFLLAAGFGATPT
jgi:hypothetical protein